MNEPEIFHVDDVVKTPNGGLATVMVVYADLGEVLVVWQTGERARFRLSQLQRVPSGAVDPQISADSIL